VSETDRQATAYDVAFAASLFHQAAAAGRQALEGAEIEHLCAGIGVTLAAGAAPCLGVRVALAHTREFGVVLEAGLGGVEAALDAQYFRKDRASVCAAVELTDAGDFLERFRRTLAWQRLAALARRDGRTLDEAPWRRCFERMLEIGGAFAPGNGETPFVLQVLELDAVQVGDPLTVGAVRCEFRAPQPARRARPVHKIDKLLHPESIGIVGVSASGMNFGRIILKNIVASGYPRERLLILRPGETEIDGVRCVAGLKALEKKLDLLIVAVAASAVYELVDEIIATDAVEAVMLIPGSLGETAKSREPAAALAARINAAHAQSGGGPVFLGANCLGVVSHPGNYDSWFIPLERLPKPKKKPERRAAMLSQSGAFMITRLSQNPWLDPRYMIAVGNQTDLTHGDFLAFFAGRTDIDTIGLYIEGFKDLDGLAFARAVRKAVLAGKDIVIYKSGQTEPGQGGVLGHTASIAGDPRLFEAVLRQAGAIVADDLDDFDALFYLAGELHGKRVGTRLGAISGAGFEAVGMADAIRSDTFAMTMGALEAVTVRRVEQTLAAKKLDALVEVRNPIDINPGADDEAHLAIAEAFLDDPNIDAVVIGLDPTAPSVRALEASQLRPGYDLHDPRSTVHRMPPIAAGHAKPLIGVIDGGRLYDAMAARLMDQGVCIFRNVSRATRALVRYTGARLAAEAVRARHRS